MATSDERERAAQASGQNIPGAVMARLLNLTERRLQQLAKEGIVPKAGRGMYPLASTVRAYVSYLQQSEGAEGELDPDKLKPFMRKAHYQAEKEKLSLAQERGELIPRIEVEMEFGRVAKIVTQALESLPDILERDAGATPPQIARTQSIIDVVREEINLSLIAPTANADSAPRQRA